MLTFEQVIREHGPTVFRVCRAMLGPAEAEDAWSETFLAALKAYPDLPDGSNVEAWLVTIAHRKAIDQHRLTARVPVPVQTMPEHPNEGPRSEDERSVSQRREDQPEQAVLEGIGPVWEALQALPEKQRAAVTYHHVAGLPYAEIATILGNSEAAARRAAADGIKRLRNTYGRGVTV